MSERGPAAPDRARSNAVLSPAPAVIVTDHAGTITYWSKEAEALYGWPAGEVTGLGILSVVSVGDETLAADVMVQLRSGRVWHGRFAVRHRDSHTVDGYVVDIPLLGPGGEVIAVVGISSSDEETVRRVVPVRDPASTADPAHPPVDALERARRLQEVTAAFSEAATPDAVAHVVVGHGVAALGADAGVVAKLDPDGQNLRIMASAGYSAAAMTEFSTFPVLGSLPLGACVLRQEMVIIEERSQWKDAFPEIAERALFDSFIGLPLEHAGEVLGAMGMSFRRPHLFDPAERQFVLYLGRLCAQAIDRSRLLEREQVARQGAEEGRDRLAFLAQLSELLAETLDYQETVARIARLSVPRLGDWCMVATLDDEGRVGPVSFVHQDLGKIALLEELARGRPVNMADTSGLGWVLRTGQPELNERIDDEFLKAAARDDHTLDALRRLGFRSGMIVPMVACGRTVGALVFAMAESGRYYDEDDLEFALHVGRRAGLSVDNARLFRTQERIAHTLQQSLLPPSLPTVPGFEFHAAYRSASLGSDLSGDFYDVVLVDGGFVCVLGDVVGKGVEAATVTGLVRHTLRAAALYTSDPVGLAEVLHAAMVDQLSDNRFASLAIARFPAAPTNGSVVAELVLAGHPPALVLRAGGTVETAGLPGMLLGLHVPPDLAVDKVDLLPGDTLVLYTDGVIDPSFPGAVDRHPVVQTLAVPGASFPQRMEEALDAAVQAAPGSLRDDAALLAIRVTA